MRELNDIQGFLDFFASVPDHQSKRILNFTQVLKM
jgi:hypothetical protein